VRALRFTLLADGSSDAYLLPILRWAVLEQGVSDVLSSPADLRHLSPAPKSLPERLRAALQVEACDLLFVHRDAEAQAPEERISEIEGAWTQAQLGSAPRWVPVIPVRMTEAWLLVSEAAIRTAAGNPRGVVPLGLPGLAGLERSANPKQKLEDALLLASGHKGRRRRQFERDMPALKHRVASLIGDFSVLRRLSAFRQLEARLTQSLAELREAGVP
jgi:hypothetical protein